LDEQLRLKIEKSLWLEKCMKRQEQPFFRSKVEPRRINLDDPIFRGQFTQAPPIDPAEL
jgi:hypothetical protein